MQRFSSKPLAAAILTALIVSNPNPVFAADGVHGQRLDPSGFGPAVIETPAEALARRSSDPTAGDDGKPGRNGQQGTWVVPGRRGTFFPHSGHKNVVNKWGDTRMGITFADVVDVHDAYFSGQAGPGVWTPGLRIIGYRAGDVIGRTPWLTALGRKPKRLAISLKGVDRIVVESRPIVGGGGWYAMDDLSFTVLTDRARGDDQPRMIDFEDVPFHTKLTGTHYADITWETGTGDFDANEGIHAPRVPPGHQPDVAPTVPDPEGGPQGDATLPLLERSFQGVLRGDGASFSFPPDTHGAIGPNHYVETVNRVFAVFDKATGNPLLSINLGVFLPGSNGDPRVVYDQHDQRWAVIVSDFAARIYFAYSLTDDPLGPWIKTSILVSQGSDELRWPDYPTLGVDANGIYTAAYMVGGGARMSVFAIDKTPLLDPTPSLGTVTAFRSLPWEGAIQPVHTWGTPPGEYLVSRRNATQIRVRRLDPPMTDPVLVELGFVPIPAHAQAPDAPALGSVTPLDTIDPRLMMAMYRDESVWTSHSIGIDGRAACRWYQFDPETVDLLQVGTVSDTSLHYFFPSIAVNQFGHAAMGFTGSSPDQYAAAYYTGRGVLDPPGAMAPPALLRAGAGAQNNIDGVGRNRWGDYSQTVLDPIEQQRIWTIQEYGHATNIWGTWIGLLSTGDCNNNGVLDACDMACDSPGADCDPADCGRVGDCNDNGFPDDCDISILLSFDFNGDGLPDECPVPGDFDGDHDVDLSDFVGFAACADAGGGATPDGCDGLDFDGDADVDLRDFSAFQDAFTGNCGVIIAQQPVDTGACPMDAAQFSVTALGDQLTYHWTHNGDLIPGATGPTLVIDPVTDEQAGAYAVYTVSQCSVALSIDATLELLPPPVITAAPQDDSTCLGAQAVFAVVAAGAEPFTYQWQFNGQNIPDAHDATLVIDPVTVDDVGGYRCVVTDDCAQNTTSPSATLTLQPFVEIIQQPVGHTYCTGETVFMLINATGTPNYQWFKDGEPIDGATAPFLAFVTTSPADSGLYHATAQNDCFWDSSDPAMVDVLNCP